MLKRVILVVCDGLADRPIKEFSWKTPLEAASTPNLDFLASRGETGLMCALGRGMRPGSDTSHLAILGYDPTDYYSGRGPIEVAGIGISLREGDVALRGNFGTVDGNWAIVDRRAGRIREVKPLTEALDGMEIDGVQVIVRPGTAHRAGVVLRGEGLSDAITDADPHELGKPLHTVEAKEDTVEAKRTAIVITKFLAKAHEILKDHPLNKEREKNKLLPANFLLLRGAGRFRSMEPFRERYGLHACCIAGGGLYKGIGSIMGMDVMDVSGATGLYDTDIKAKFRCAMEKMKSYDFAFVHVKAADSLAEDGDFLKKREFIEKTDEASRILVDGLEEDMLLVFTADHTTPCELQQHSADPVPLMFCGTSVRIDSVCAFGERACASGGLGFFRGLDVMPHISNLLGRLPLIGA